MLLNVFQLGLDEEDLDADEFMEEESDSEDDDDTCDDRGHGGQDVEEVKCPHSRGSSMKISCCPHPPYVYSSGGPVCGGSLLDGTTVHKLPCGHYGVPTKDVAIQGEHQGDNLTNVWIIMPR